MLLSSSISSRSSKPASATRQAALSSKRDELVMYWIASARSAAIAESTLRMAIGRTKGKAQCPCCGQVVRAGFELDRSVLKESAE